MLDRLDMKTRLSRKDYEDSLGELHRELGLLQRQLREKAVPFLVVVEGWEASGKGYVINELIRPLDPRGFVVRDETEVDLNAPFYPGMWRFWDLLPEKGRITILNRSWYRLYFQESKTRLDVKESLELLLMRYRSFEELLADEGIHLLKIFLHVGPKEQKKRLKALSSDPSTRWRVSEKDLEENRNYATHLEKWESLLTQSDTAQSPWLCLPAEDLQVAAKGALNALLLFFRRALAESPVKTGEPSASLPTPDIFSRIDLSLSLSEEEYREKLESLQKGLLERQYDLYRKGKSLVVLFEGWDAAGKGGAIKRLTERLDPRGYVVHPISAPTAWEEAHPYLWRFWTRLPKRGHIVIFDRSWYGRVLVERVENYCSEEDWKRAYGEINQMESEWVEAGFVLVKFWMHIDEDEQLKRFQKREENEYKKWKITEEDWRNRGKREMYVKAVEEMLLRTSPPGAPWTIVEGNDKRFARIKVLKTVLSSMDSILERD